MRFSPPGRMTREKTRTTSFLFSPKEGMTTPIRVAPASRRALAHRAAASISCFAESKAARETVADRASGLQKAISVPSAFEELLRLRGQDVERVGDNELRQLQLRQESLQRIRQPRGIEVVLGFPL